MSKILVVGHVYDIMDLPTTDINNFVNFINDQNADMVVFGGDRIYGAQDDASYATLQNQWDNFYSLIRNRIVNRTVMVAGNHDGWSYDSRFQQLSKQEFLKRNPHDYTMKVTSNGKTYGLHFIYTGNFTFPMSHFPQFTASFPSHDENLMFGGHKHQTVLDTLKTSPRPLKYFSGDWSDNNSPITQGNVTAYNITSYCPSGFDAILIELGSTTNISNLGSCWH